MYPPNSPADLSVPLRPVLDTSGKPIGSVLAGSSSDWVGRIKPTTGDKRHMSMNSISSDISLLYKISNAIKYAGTSSREARAAAYFEGADEEAKEGLQEFDDTFAPWIVSQTCPAAPPPIQHRLIGSMRRRRRRLLYQNLRHNEKLRKARESAIPLVGGDSVLLTDERSSASSLLTDKSQQEVSVATETATLRTESSAATTLNANLFQEALLHSQVTRPSTRVSRDGSMRLVFPPIPEAKDGEDPACPYCFATLSTEEISEPRMWQ